MTLTYEDMDWDDDCDCGGCEGRTCDECAQASPCYLVGPGDHRVMDFDLTCGELRAHMRNGWLWADEDDIAGHDDEPAGSDRYLDASIVFVSEVVTVSDAAACGATPAAIWTPAFSLN